MRVVIQRVLQANVIVSEQTVGEITKGLLVFVGIEEADAIDDIIWLSSKIVDMRLFSDTENKMNLSVKDISGGILLISQFTLHASTKKGNRPSFIKAAKPTTAEALYQQFIQQLSITLGKPIATGIFGANMQVTLVNDGPVTIIVDSKQRE